MVLKLLKSGIKHELAARNSQESNNLEQVRFIQSASLHSKRELSEASIAARQSKPAKEKVYFVAKIEFVDKLMRNYCEENIF